MIERKQINRLRYFYPNEWDKYQASILNTKHEFLSEAMLQTGCRISELRNLKVKHINFERNYFEIHKSKTKEPREVMFSSRFARVLTKHINQNKLGKEDRLGFPSTQYLDKMIKGYAKKAGLHNPEDFSCHSFRKTHENWLCAIGVNTMLITKQLGHTIKVADAYYVSQTKFNQQEKSTIRHILGDLFQVDNFTTTINQSPDNSLNNAYLNQENGQYGLSNQNKST